MAAARRVVTAHKDKKSVVVADNKMDEFAFGPFSIQQIWGSPTSPPSLAFSDHIDFTGQWFPAPGGIRSFRVSIAPESAVEAEPDAAALADAAARMPGALQHFEPDHPGMHTTQSVDIGIVQAGEVWLELDDGEEVHLQAGDYVVQYGTRHGWHNRTGEPCVIAFFVIGATAET
jgi:quercetin dioxygenase-like cupin family protein